MSRISELFGNTSKFNKWSCWHHKATIAKDGYIYIYNFKKETKVTDVCSVCGNPQDPEDKVGYSELRPYGKDGAFICFNCAMKEENIKETNRQFFKLKAEKIKAANNKTVKIIGDVIEKTISTSSI